MSTRALWIVLAAGVVGAGCSPKLTGAKCDYDTNCPSGQTCQKAAGATSGQCVDQCGLTCTGGYTCGFASGQAACQCPPNITGTFVVDPVLGSDAGSSPYPTGVAQPANCRFTRLTDALAWANDYATINTQATPGATVQAKAPVPPALTTDFTAESYPLMVGGGVLVTTETSAPSQYVIHLNTDAGVVLSPGAGLQGYTVEDDVGAVTGAVSCVSGGAQPATLTSVRVFIYDGGLSAGPNFGVSYPDGGGISPPAAVVVSSGCTLNANDLNLTSPGVGIWAMAGGTASVDGGQITANVNGLEATSGTINGTGLRMAPLGASGFGVLANGTGAVNLSQSSVTGYDGGLWAANGAAVNVQSTMLTGNWTENVMLTEEARFTATNSAITDGGYYDLLVIGDAGDPTGPSVTLVDTTLGNSTYGAVLVSRSSMAMQGGALFNTLYGLFGEGSGYVSGYAAPTVTLGPSNAGPLQAQNGSYGVLTYGANLSVQGSNFLGWYAALEDLVYAGQTGTIQNDSFSGNTYNIVVAYAYDNDAGRPAVSVSGCVIDGGTYGIYLASPVSATVSNNTVRYGSTGLYMPGSVANSHIVFTGNEIFGGQNGAYLDGVQPAIWSFQGNHIHGNSAAQIYVNSGTWDLSTPASCAQANYLQCYTAGTFGIAVNGANAVAVTANNEVWDQNSPVPGTDYASTGVTVGSSCVLPVNPPVCP